MLSATEYHMREPVPLHRVHTAIFEFCRQRQDVVVFGAQAVNVYVAEVRMTQDVDLLSGHPEQLADELAHFLQDALTIAARVREIKAGIAYRVYQLRREGNRHLADIRRAEFSLDDALEQDGIHYTSLVVTCAMKAAAYTKRRLAPKGATDLADLRRLLLAHPELRSKRGPVATAIERIGGDEEVARTWRELVEAPLISDEDADEGY